VDGSEFTNSRDILQECKDLNKERVGANGTTVDHGGLVGRDEVVGIPKSLCAAGTEVGANEKMKESGACTTKVQMNVDKTSIHSTVILRSRSSGETKVAEGDANEIEDNVVPHSMGFTSPNARDMGKGNEIFIPDSQVLVPCAPP